MNAILCDWVYRASTDVVAPVLPDGCCDLILQFAPGAASRLLFSGLDPAIRHVRLGPGTTLVGARLRAGIVEADFGLAPRSTLGRVVSLEPWRIGLSALPEGEGPSTLSDMAAGLASVLGGRTPRVPEMLSCLAETRSVERAAQRLGVSARTVHRYVSGHTGFAPSDWVDLARARRALAVLPDPVSLAEIAHGAGYADQPHMTRSFGRWFRRTPAALRADRVLIRRAGDPGFAGNTA